MRRQIAEAKKHNMRVVYDISQQVANCPPEDLRAGIEAAELVVVNDYEASMLFERSGFNQKEALKMLKTLVITRGKEGSDIFTRGKKPKKIKAIISDKEVDPTGAGDAYRAGFLYGYVRQWDEETCGQMGAVAASYAVDTHGTQNHYFSVEDIQKRYKENFGKEIDLS
jgi:adenosine kinase